MNTITLRRPACVRLGSDRRRSHRGAFLDSSHAQTDLALVERVLSRDRAALDEFVARSTPIIQRRVARWLARQPQSPVRNIRQELQDFVQEVFADLFENDARALRSWQPGKGLSLDNFIGLIAERVAVSILRSGRRHPWRDEPRAEDQMPSPRQTASEPDAVNESAQSLQLLLEKLRVAVSPKGWRMFEMLYLEEKSVADVQRVAGMSQPAVHQWRSRLRRLACELHAEITAPVEREDAP